MIFDSGKCSRWKDGGWPVAIKSYPTLWHMERWRLIWPRKFYLSLWSVPHLPTGHSAPCQTLINLPIKQSLPLQPLLAITDLAGTLNINSISISQFIMSRHGWTQALFGWKDHHESLWCVCWIAEVELIIKHLISISYDVWPFYWNLTFIFYHRSFRAPNTRYVACQGIIKHPTNLN